MIQKQLIHVIYSSSLIPRWYTPPPAWCRPTPILRKVPRGPRRPSRGSHHLPRSPSLATSSHSFKPKPAPHQVVWAEPTDPPSPPQLPAAYTLLSPPATFASSSHGSQSASCPAERAQTNTRTSFLPLQTL